MLLLGNTPALLSLTSEAWDACPVDERVTKRDWRSLDRPFDTVIGDGAFNLDAELTERMLVLCAAHCDRLVMRSFLAPSWKPRYARFFPRAEDFSTVPRTLPVNDVYCFYVWDFR